MEQRKYSFDIFKMLILVFVLHLCNSSIFFSDYLYLQQGPSSTPVSRTSETDSMPSVPYIHHANSKLILLFIPDLSLAHNLTNIATDSSILLSPMAQSGSHHAELARLLTGFDPNTTFQDYVYSYHTIHLTEESLDELWERSAINVTVIGDHVWQKLHGKQAESLGLIGDLGPEDHIDRAVEARLFDRAEDASTKVLVARFTGLSELVREFGNSDPKTQAKLERLGKIVKDTVENEIYNATVFVFGSDYVQAFQRFRSGPTLEEIRETCGGRDRVELSDLAPTLAYLTNVSIPAQSLGVIIPHFVTESCTRAYYWNALHLLQFTARDVNPKEPFVADTKQKLNEIHEQLVLNSAKSETAERLMKIMGSMRQVLREHYSSSQGSMIAKLCVANHIGLLVILGIFLFLAYQLKSFSFLQDFPILLNRPLLILGVVFLVTWKFNNYSVLVIDTTLVILHLIYKSAVAFARHHAGTEPLPLSCLASNAVRYAMFVFLLITISSCQDAYKTDAAMYALMTVAIIALAEKGKDHGISLRDVIMLILFGVFIHSAKQKFHFVFRPVAEAFASIIWFVVMKTIMYIKLLQASGKARCRLPFVGMNFCLLLISDGCILLYQLSFFHLNQLVYFFATFHLVFLAFCTTSPQKLIFGALKAEQFPHENANRLYKVFLLVFWYSQVFVNVYLNLIGSAPAEYFVLYIVVFGIYKSISGKRSNIQMDAIFSVLSAYLVAIMLRYRYSAADMESYVKNNNTSVGILDYIGMAMSLTAPFVICFVTTALFTLEACSNKIKPKKKARKQKASPRGDSSPRKEIKSEEEIEKQCNINVIRNLTACLFTMGVKIACDMVPIYVKRLRIDYEGYQLWVENWALQAWILFSALVIIQIAQ